MILMYVWWRVHEWMCVYVCERDINGMRSLAPYEMIFSVKLISHFAFPMIIYMYIMSIRFPFTWIIHVQYFFFQKKVNSLIGWNISAVRANTDTLLCACRSQFKRMNKHVNCSFYIIVSVCFPIHPYIGCFGKKLCIYLYRFHFVHYIYVPLASRHSQC